MDTDLIKKTIRLLHLEDNKNDQLLVREMLEAEGLPCELETVQTRAEFEAALTQGNYDLIISDFSLPSFDGLKALTFAHKQAPQTPFIFFSGTIGEEAAVDSLKYGAIDYVLKERPHRLIAAVRNAIRSAAERSRRRSAESKLEKIEERFRIVARATNDVVWEWDISAGTVWFSDNFEMAFGHRTGGAGMTPSQWFDLVHPDDKGGVVAGISTMLANGGRVWWSEHRLRRTDGSYAHVFDRATIIYDVARKPQRMIGVKIDMSERKLADEKIREQAGLLDKAQDAIIVLDLNGRVVYWNKGAERIYGWSADEIRGQDLRQFFFRGAPPSELDELVKKTKTHGDAVGELREFTKDGRQIIIQTRPTLVRDEKGQTKSVLLINTDITERKQIEEQFLRAQRLESLGVLVSGIAHDLNNALVPMIVGTDILHEEKLSDDATTILQTMRISARRSADMVKQMLVFARGDEASKTFVHVNLLVKEMGKIIGDTFPKSIECRVQVAKDSWPVYGLPTQLHQVLLNLCVNARDAMMPAGGKLTLSTKNVVLSPDQAAAGIKAARPGKYLCITVTDTGTGIAPENLEKIFQPFFTTKTPDKGTGLGLSTCMSILKSHDGFVRVNSRLKAGTGFEVYLPATGIAAPQTAAILPRELPTGNGECILVVDDEQGILAITRAALENYGYTVMAAASGPEAIGCLLKKPDAINLVITDLSMPFMNGGETVEALRKIRSDIKIIVACGVDEEDSPQLQQIKSQAIIFKPFTNEHLIETIHAVLE